MEWPRVLRRQLRCTLSPVPTLVTGGTSIRASHSVWRERPPSPSPGMAETYGCPNRNSANVRTRPSGLLPDYIRQKKKRNIPIKCPLIINHYDRS
ncbi:Uncharacterized protein FWK35_00020540 [Aphis craccivora]|uniref:Uncharacterized protein n=1 Tax=Aphis craccivora TaxID=307492 RepID=A0A6G0YTJ2_APHCR|nr:Uncharacterized protein FWK35_00020540 [Aphis craccivora]